MYIMNGEEYTMCDYLLVLLRHLPRFLVALLHLVVMSGATTRATITIPHYTDLSRQRHRMGPPSCTRGLRGTPNPSAAARQYQTNLDAVHTPGPPLDLTSDTWQDDPALID